MTPMRAGASDVDAVPSSLFHLSRHKNAPRSRLTFSSTFSFKIVSTRRFDVVLFSRQPLISVLKKEGVGMDSVVSG